MPLLGIHCTECCTAFVLFRRRLIQKLWPVVYFLLAFILEIEYVAWNNLFPKISWLQVKPVCIATTAGGLELSTLNFAGRHLMFYMHYLFSLHIQELGSILRLFFYSCLQELELTTAGPLLAISWCLCFTCFKLQADHVSSFSESSTYHKFLRKNSFVFI
ncbi:unnamed protein product [Brassica rapa subsp. trilocularis]